MIVDTWATKAAPMGLDYYDGAAWQPISLDDLGDEGITVVRGRRGGQRADPAEMTCRLRNATGTYNTLLGRNTSVRAWVEVGATRLVVPAATGAGAGCPDSAGLSLTGDMDLRIDCRLRSWRKESNLLGKWHDPGQMSYLIKVTADGRLQFAFSLDGTTPSVSGASTVILPVATGRLSVRVAFDANNGGVRNYTFYYSTTPGLAGPWTQLGAVVVGGASAALFDSTADLTVGNTFGSATFDGQVYAAEVRSSIAGTVVASPDFNAQPSGAASITDAQGNVWTPAGGASITDRHYRFWGSVVRRPPRWTRQGGPSAYADVTAAGNTRRLGQGAAPLPSPIRRVLAAIGANLVGYWPCEDAGITSSIAADVGRPAQVAGSGLSAGAYSGFAASDPLPTLGGGRIIATVPSYVAGNYGQVRHLIRCPAGTPNNAIIARIYLTGSLARIDIVYTTAGSGTLTATGYDRHDTSVGTRTLNVALDGQDIRLSTELTQVAGNITWAFASYQEGAAYGYVDTSSLTGQSFGRVTRVELNPGGAALADVSAGHLTVEKAVTSLFDVSVSAMVGYAGETASARVVRLCTENGITAAAPVASLAELGPQTTEPLLDLLDACEDVDGGYLVERRDADALEFRSIEMVYNAEPTAAITYTDNLLLPFAPDEADSDVHNRVTVTRAGGSSATSEVTTGPLSTARPPSGAGVYASSVTLPLNTDARAMQQASWATFLGTVDEYRWPTIGAQLAHPTIKANPTLIRDLLELDQGDRLTVASLPAWLPTASVDQLVDGYTERITPDRYGIEWACRPASPYQVATYDRARYSGAGTVLAVALPADKVTFAGAQCMSVAGANPTGDFDVRIRVSLTDWTPAAEQLLIGKYINAGNQRAWAAGINTTGKPIMYVSVDGTAFVTATASVATGFADGSTHWLRYVFDAADAVNWSVSFYTSSDGATWSLLGTKQAGAAPGPTFASSGQYQLGARSGTSLTGSMVGTVTYVDIRNGIGAAAALVPVDPGDWTAGYGGAGTGAVVAAQTPTEVTVTPPGAVTWSHVSADGDYPVEVGTEVLSVTAAAALAGGVQVLSVTRAGPTALHAAGAALDLATPAHYAL